MAMTLAYWNIRGLAQHIRLLLEYTGTEYQDTFYHCGEAPHYRSCWPGEKHLLGLDFPNLPYLIDGKHKIVQSNAIMRYIARKHNMCGETEDEKIRVDMVENQAMDFRMGFGRLCYMNFNPEEEKKYKENLPTTLKQFSDFLGDRKWFAGEKITFVDFIVYELLDVHCMFHPSCLEDFKNLKDFLCRFEALDKIDAYIKSDRFMKNPVNNKMAKWGNTK